MIRAWLSQLTQLLPILVRVGKSKVAVGHRDADGDEDEDQDDRDDEQVHFWRLKEIPELMWSPDLGNVWVFVPMIRRPTRTKNQLYKNHTLCKNPNIA